MKDANDYIVGPGQFYLFKITDTLDNINYIRDREKAYYQAYSELEKFIPYMDEVNKYSYENNYGSASELPMTWQKFVEIFHSIEPRPATKKWLENEFYKELERLKEGIISNAKVKKMHDYKKEFDNIDNLI